MTFAQLQAFAESKDQSVIRIALTREGARLLVSEFVEAETRICSCCGTPRNEFDPGKPDKPGDVAFAFARFARMGAENARINSDAIVAETAERIERKITERSML